MRVCVVNLNFYCLFERKSDAPMGGAELDMYIVANSLNSFFEVSAITGDWGQEKIEIKDGITIFRSFSLKKKLWNYIRAPFIFWSSLNRANADVFIFSGAGPEVGVIAFFCKIKHKKFVYRTAHLIDCNGVYVTSKGFLGKVYDYGLKNACLIVTSVRQHRKELLNLYPSLISRINHVNLGIVGGGGKSEKEYILWVARCEKWKNPEYFLDIAEKFSSLNFVMICPCASNSVYFDAIKKRALSIRNVRFIDFVPFEKIQPYFDRSKIFINTSSAEGFTYTLLQSGLAGTPVIYLNVNPDEVITHHDIGYFSNGDKSIMLSQIDYLINHPDILLKKSENISLYVKENHNMKFLGEEWKNLICKL